MPGANTEGFTAPDKLVEAVFGDIVMDMEQGKTEIAAVEASAYHYEILDVTTPGGGRTEYYILREMLPISRGWGTYIFQKDFVNDIVIEIPHPISDRNTPLVGLGLFKALNAKALLIAGTHRNANKDGMADTAHATDSIFQAVHLALVQEASQTYAEVIFLQLHGFSSDRHPHFPQVIIGHNWQSDPIKDRLLNKLVQAMQDENIQVGVCPNKDFQDLCGTLNIQSLETKDQAFFHLELNESTRQDDSAFVSALVKALNSSSP